MCAGLVREMCLCRPLAFGRSQSHYEEMCVAGLQLLADYKMCHLCCQPWFGTCPASSKLIPPHTESVLTCGGGSCFTTLTLWPNLKALHPPPMWLTHCVSVATHEPACLWEKLWAILSFSIQTPRRPLGNNPTVSVNAHFSHHHCVK